jgi:hypothetical protein
MRHRDAATGRGRRRTGMLSRTGKGGGGEVIRLGGAFLPMRAVRLTRLLARRPTWSFSHLMRAA